LPVLNQRQLAVFEAHHDHSYSGLRWLCSFNRLLPDSLSTQNHRRTYRHRQFAELESCHRVPHSISQLPAPIQIASRQPIGVA
jgi:hypothetical protein